jgi:hypothetical protein
MQIQGLGGRRGTGASSDAKKQDVQPVLHKPTV